MGIRGEVFSSKAMTEGKRTYFFNVKENRHGDLFLNLVESKKHGEEGFERHSVIVFDEDLDIFLEEFNRAVAFMKKSQGDSDKPRRYNGSGKPYQRPGSDEKPSYRSSGDNKIFRKPSEDGKPYNRPSGDAKPSYRPTDDGKPLHRPAGDRKPRD